MKRVLSKKWVSVVFWTIMVIAIWEIFAFIVSGTKRTPENVLPHLYQIVAAAFSPKQVANGMSASLVVLSSAKLTLLRAFIGFLIGASAGYLLALIM